jgi:hypothetical protein
MSADESPRQRLAEHMNRCRLELGLQWKEFATISKVSVATLRRICDPKDFDRPVSDRSKAGIEKGLRWRPGAVDRILAEPNYRPDGRPLGRDASIEDIVRYLDDLRAVAPGDFQQVLHRLDINWAPQVSAEPPAPSVKTLPSAT